MKVSEAFPSKYLAAADLHDRNVTVIMGRVEMEELGKEQKPVLYFKGKEKGLVLNKTNSTTIAAAYGDETNDWQGQELILFPIMTEYQGKTVPAIRVRMPQPKDRPKQSPQQNTERGNSMDDEIPF